MRHPDRGEAISEAVGDCDRRTKMYGAGLGGICVTVEEEKVG
jgi:hypothetical protein